MIGVTSAVFSTSGLAVSLSGIGMIIGAPMVNLTGLFVLISTAFTAGGKRLNKKITKIERTISISEAKHLSVCRLTSKAMDNNSISDIEFNSILLEIEQNYSLKSS